MLRVRSSDAPARPTRHPWAIFGPGGFGSRKWFGCAGAQSIACMQSFSATQEDALARHRSPFSLTSRSLPSMPWAASSRSPSAI